MTSNTTLPSVTDGETATTTATDRTITVDAATGEHRARHDFEGERRLSTSVVLAVANALGSDPLALDERLYDVLDPDALDRLFGDETPASGTRRLAFELAGCAVTVHADGRIVVRPGA